MLTELVTEHQEELGILSCCDAIGMPRSSYYRARTPKHGPHRRRKVPRALTESEQKEVLDTLRSERFCDQAPAQVVATLLDEGRYLCSERTMYRLLSAHGEVLERRDQVRIRPVHTMGFGCRGLNQAAGTRQLFFLRTLC